MVSRAKRQAPDAEIESASKRARRNTAQSTDSIEDSDIQFELELPREEAQDDTTAHSPVLSDDRFILRPNVYQCTFPDCGRVFSRPCRLTEHERFHTGERPFTCNHMDCDKTFQRDYHLSRHIKVAHEGLRNFVCSYEECDKKYATGQRLREHMKGHEKKKEFTCTGHGLCAEVFRKKSTLQAHISTAHLNQKPYPCTQIDDFTGEPCKKGYDTAGKLNGHVAKVHGGERYICTICSGATSTDSGVSIPNDSSTSPATPNSTVFSLPSYIFPSYNQLQSHIVQAHPPSCPHCNRPCKSKKDLASHIEVHHQDVAGVLPPAKPAPTFPCEYESCGRIFSKKGNLTVHIRTVHENIKNFVCGETDLRGSSRLIYDDGTEAEWTVGDGCGQGFGTKAMLENHVRAKHLGLDNWDKVCRRKKEASLPSSSKPTKRAGGNQKAMPFAAASLLTGLGYEDSGRDITCLRSDCENKFFRETDLRRHCTSVHGMADVEIEECLREREALKGGKFWFGGIDPDDERGFAEYEEDDEGYDARFLGRDAGSMQFEEMSPLDPQLEAMDRIAEFVRGVENA